MKTLIVGAGFTGGALARLLHDAKRAGAYASDVLVWEKNSIAGGRAMARSFPLNRAAHVDMGAQYWTRLSELNDDVRAELLRAGALVPFADAKIAKDTHRRADALDHAVSSDAKGFRAVAERFLDDTPVAFSSALASIEIIGTNAIKVTSSAGAEEVVSELVLTCPVPNILSILEQSATLNVPAAKIRALAAVEYSQRFAVAFLFDASVAKYAKALGWTARYVSKDEDDIVRFMCWDGLKKEAESDVATLLVHTSVPYGMAHMGDDKQRDGELLAAISRSVRKLLPSLPDEEEDVLLHRWRVSQVTKKLNLGNDSGIDGTDSAGAAANGRPAVLELSKHPRILVAGDAFLGSNFDSCLLSAKAAAAVLMSSAVTSSY